MRGRGREQEEGVRRRPRKRRRRRGRTRIRPARQGSSQDRRKSEEKSQKNEKREFGVSKAKSVQVTTLERKKKSRFLRRTMGNRKRLRKLRC